MVIVVALDWLSSNIKNIQIKYEIWLWNYYGILGKYMNRGQSLLSMKNVRYKDIRYSMSKRGRNIFMSIWTGASHLIPLLLLAWVSRLDVSEDIRFRHQPPELQSTRTYPTPPSRSISWSCHIRGPPVRSIRTKRAIILYSLRSKISVILILR
jgi:hypothetical protein